MNRQMDREVDRQAGSQMDRQHRPMSAPEVERHNNIATKTNSINNGYREIEFSSFADGRNDSWFVEICRLFAMEGVFDLDTEPFDRTYQ